MVALACLLLLYHAWPRLDDDEDAYELWWGM